MMKKLAIILCLSTTGAFFAASSAMAQEELKSLEGPDLRAEFQARDQLLDPLVTGSISDREETFKYCLNISDAAAETRNAVVANQLRELSKEVDEKLDILDGRIAELRKWMEMRQTFLDSADDSLVKIFQAMRPDAAALQLTEVGPGMAAAIISKLSPKSSSAIMAEMKPADAAKITLVLTNAMVTDGQS